MDYLEFRKAFFDTVSFSTNQIEARFSGFNNNNLTRWTKKGLVIKLRNGHYSFREYLTAPSTPFYIANRIYRPSYVSLHSALAFYGLIPEAVVQTISVSSLKTVEFKNKFGTFVYKTVLPALMFGYDQKPFIKSMSFLLAQPEKALLDLLYLYPYYNTAEEIKALRLDEDLMHEIINLKKLNDYAAKFKNKSISKRVNLIIDYYQL